MQTVTCPKCGAKLFVEAPDEGVLFCEYCGARVSLDPNIRYVYGHPLLSKIKTLFARAYTYARTNTRKALAIFLCALILITGGAFAATHTALDYAATSQHRAKLDELQHESDVNYHLSIGEAQFPEDINMLEDYRILVKHLKKAGFTNVQAKPVKDLIIGYWNSKNTIVEIEVDGAPEYEEGAWYPVDTPIVVSYHDFIRSRD